MPVEPGRTVGERFVVEHKAATGGMGIVYRARDLRDGSPIALKVIGRSFDFDERRFVREAEVLAELRHPGIVRYVAHGRHDGEAWLAMEWLDGEDLAQRIGRTGLTVDESVRAVARVAEALGSAHALGIVHRDIKPSNIFLLGREVDRPRLLDFGIARSGLELTGAITQSGVLLGTPGYMAPEQAHGGAVDARADVYALGCVLFECLTGRPAFAGDHPMALLAKIVLGDAPRVLDVRPELSAELDALVSKMVARTPRTGRATAQRSRICSRRTSLTQGAWRRRAPRDRSSPGTSDAWSRRCSPSSRTMQRPMPPSSPGRRRRPARVARSSRCAPSSSNSARASSCFRAAPWSSQCMESVRRSISPRVPLVAPSAFVPTSPTPRSPWRPGAPS